VIRLVIKTAVVPQQAQVAVMHADFGNKALAEKIGFVLAQMHVVDVA
jgi:hypothetical protein